MESIAKLYEAAQRPTSKYDTYYYAYDELFAPYRGKDITFVEIGIQGGGSMEVWKKYFGENARVIGIDLNPVIQKELQEDGFEVFVGDQSSEDFWKQFFEEVGPVDILLDDGGHTNFQTKSTIQYCIDQSNDGGMLVIEDTHASYMKKFGNPSSDSLISYTKEIVDLVNGRSSRIDKKMKDEHGYASKVHSVQYFESIVALRVNRELSHTSNKTNYGDTNNLSIKAVPEDFRYEGIEKKPKKKGWFS